MNKDMQIRDEVRKRLEEEKKIPLKVSIMGQTGVGKSSLLNALFNTQLKTDPIRPCTKEIERVVTRGRSNHELWFYDLPGIGEAGKADTQYLESYREKLIESDVVLWAIHADSRSVTFDLDALFKILKSVDKIEQGRLMSKIIFVLTKADLLTPPPWILNQIGNNGVFIPHPDTTGVLEQKEHYYQETFILPFGNLITTQTYHKGDFTIDAPPLSYDRSNAYYQGFLSKETVIQLKKQFPGHDDVFNRLYDGCRVISCSSLFRYNLLLLMRIIVDKLGVEAIARFRNFYTNQEMNVISLSRARGYCNMRIVDSHKGRMVFDLARMKL
jgi:uncharacterized protein